MNIGGKVGTYLLQVIDYNLKATILINGLELFLMTFNRKMAQVMINLL